MATKPDLDASNLYASIMEEIKVRILSINTLTNAKIGVPSPLVREFCFLQFRMTCELIALGCLVAHGDIEATKSSSLQKAYKADEILKRLEELHPDFYPVPRKPVFGENLVHLDDYGREFLTKDDLIQLYVKCGGVLHKGSLRKLIKPKSPLQINFPEINQVGQKVLNLLSVHTISRIGGRFHFLTFLEAAQVNGNVLVSIAEGPHEAEQK